MQHNHPLKHSLQSKLQLVWTTLQALAKLKQDGGDSVRRSCTWTWSFFCKDRKRFNRFCKLCFGLPHSAVFVHSFPNNTCHSWQSIYTKAINQSSSFSSPHKVERRWCPQTGFEPRAAEWKVQTNPLLWLLLVNNWNWS